MKTANTTTPVTTTTNTKTVFQKAPFRVLAALLLIEGVMIGQVLSRPGEAKEPTAKTEVTTTAAQDLKDWKCQEIANLLTQRDCWARKAKAGEKNLQGAFLQGVRLVGVDLSKADLTKADLSYTYLYRVNLSGAKLNGADLTKANLFGANLSGVTLSGANLVFADLGGADLSGADLRGTDLRGATLSKQNRVANLKDIKKDENTKGLPPGH